MDVELWADYASVTELLVDFIYNVHVAPEWGVGE